MVSEILALMGGFNLLFFQSSCFIPFCCLFFFAVSNKLIFFIVCIAGLDRGTEYNFRVASLTVNGTGPATDWLSAETFESDLDGKSNNQQDWNSLGTN